MINVFKALNPLNILRLGILLVALRGVYWFFAPSKIDFAFSGTYARLLIPAVSNYSFSSGTNIFLAAVIVFIQAVLLNYLVNHFNLLGKPTLLPAVMFVTISGLFTPFLVLSPPLLCNFFIIWMLFKLLNFYKTKDAIPSAYDMGMIVGIGSIIYMPFTYLFLVCWAGLIIFRPLHWREFLAGIVGYITIFFFLAVFYYLNDHLDKFSEIWEPLTTSFTKKPGVHYYSYLELIPVCLILILCFFKIQQNFFRSYVQTRKSFQLIFILLIITIVSVYVKEAYQLYHFTLCAVPGAILFAYYFLYAKQRWFYESLYFILITSIIYFQFNTF
jgi:hypothetical protein